MIMTTTTAVAAQVPFKEVPLNGTFFLFQPIPGVAYWPSQMLCRCEEGLTGDNAFCLGDARSFCFPAESLVWILREE